MKLKYKFKHPWEFWNYACNNLTVFVGIGYNNKEYSFGIDEVMNSKYQGDVDLGTLKN
jgi:hypothetical protein